MQKNNFIRTCNYCLFIISLLLSIAISGCKTQTVARQTQVNKIVMEDTVKPSQLVSLPVFIPVEQLQKQLYKLYFEPTYGKFYPCAGHDDCSDLYKDLYLENPMLNVKGDLISIHLHLSGNTKLLLLHPSVSGEITLTAKPVVSNDTLYFENVKMEKSSQSFLLKVASVLFEKKIIAKIQSSAWFSFRPCLDNYTKDFQKQLPLKNESTVLLLSLKRIYLKKVSTMQSPTEGILADFSAEICTEKPGYGQ